MPKYTYKAKDYRGKAIEGTLEAPNRVAASVTIENLGYIPVSILEVKEDSKQQISQPIKTIKKGKRLKRRQMLLFTIELADLLDAGMTIGQALQSIASRSKPEVKQIIEDIRMSIIQGASLSKALSEYPESFPNLYISLVEAGEASGTLHIILKRLVTHYERVMDVRDKIISALIYPVIVLAIGIATLIFAMLVVIPKIEKIFSELGQILPPATRFLIATSKFIASYGIFIILGITIVIFILKKAISSMRGKLLWDSFLLKYCIGIRSIINASIFSNIARTLAILIENGVPLIKALKITAKTVDNAVIIKEMEKAYDRVIDGTTISKPLSESKIFPSLFIDMVAIGEQSGDLPSALEKVAERFEKNLERNLKIFITMLEPSLIIIVAMCVGFIALSILTAVFRISSGIQ